MSPLTLDAAAQPGVKIAQGKAGNQLSRLVPLEVRPPAVHKGVPYLDYPAKILSIGLRLPAQETKTARGLQSGLAFFFDLCCELVMPPYRGTSIRNSGSNSEDDRSPFPPPA
jgi:hypothetical protein